MSDANPIVSAQFSDSDAYFEAINDVNVRFTLQGLESSNWRISSLTLPFGIRIQHCWSGSGSIAQGVSRDGGFELAIPATGRYAANAEQVPVESALFMVPGSEFLVTIPGIHSWFGVFLPEALADSIGLAKNSEGRRPTSTRVIANAALGTCSVPLLLTRFFSNARLSRGRTCTVWSLRCFGDELLGVLARAYGCLPEPGGKRPGRKPVFDHVSVNRALDFIEASPEGIVSMANLVDATSVSERSLRAGFSKYLGMSPTRYMQLRMLNTARSRLAAASPEDSSVSEVVTSLGVWDLGRFAARYRQTFGELPSSTLRRTG